MAKIPTLRARVKETQLVKPRRVQPTLNVKNIKSNEVFIQQLLKTVDILCIQEHWLFNFELDLLNSILIHKAVDDNDSVSPIGPQEGMVEWEYSTEKIGI